MRANKRNAVDDFIAAAEWLVAEGWTRPAGLSIYGHSNGGLLALVADGGLDPARFVAMAHATAAATADATAWALMPLLEAASTASVVLTSSGVGRQGKAYWGAYAVSKFATEGFMQVLADELSATSSVRVNSLNPGAVNTGMRRAAYPGEPPDTNPAPAALTDRWLYLLSDASRDLHGQALSAQR